MSDEKIEKLAVLIDTDNAESSIIEGLLSEIAKYGTANVKIAKAGEVPCSFSFWQDLEASVIARKSHLDRHSAFHRSDLQWFSDELGLCSYIY